MNIYVSEKHNNPQELLYGVIENNWNTYKDKECTQLECIGSKQRTMSALSYILDTYYKDLNLYEELLKVNFNKKYTIGYCPYAGGETFNSVDWRQPWVDYNESYYYVSDNICAYKKYDRTEKHIKEFKVFKPIQAIPEEIG